MTALILQINGLHKGLNAHVAEINGIIFMKRNAKFAIVIGCVAGCLLGGLFWYASYYRRFIREVEAIHCVATTSLYYIYTNKCPPRLLGDLLRHESITISEGTLDFRVSSRNIDSAPWEEFSNAYLSFPLRYDELELRGDKLIEKATGKEHFLVVLAPSLLGKREFRNTTRYIWEEWRNIEQGKPPSWLDKVPKLQKGEKATY